MSLTDNIVAITRCEHYEEREIEKALSEIMLHFGTISQLVREGQRVLLKPNLLAGAGPAEAVTTHPLVVKTVAIMVQKAGGKVLIGDGPGSGSQEAAHRKAGYLQVMEETGAEMLLFDHAGPLKGPREGSAIPLVEALNEVDLVINLAKLKTHSLTGMTAAVKNCYGCLGSGFKKRYHLEKPLPHEFAKLVVEICLAVKPDFSIIDAVVAMEGMGPRSGKPKKTGLILGARNPFALDAAAAQIIGFSPHEALTVAAALDRKLPGAKVNELNYPELSPELCKVSDFDRGPAQSGKIAGLLTRLPLAWLRNRMQARRPYPYFKPSLCTACGICKKGCPLQIITIEGGAPPEIELASCIRCYCCQELCPEGAISL